MLLFTLMELLSIENMEMEELLTSMEIISAMELDV